MSQDDSTPPPVYDEDAPIRLHGERCPRCGGTKLNSAGYTHDRTHHGEATRGKWYTVYDRVRSVDHYCETCRLYEQCADDQEGYVAFTERWRDKRIKVTWADVDRINAETDRMRERNQRAMTWPLEPDIEHTSETRDRFQQQRIADYPKAHPEHDALLGEIYAHPDDDAPRWAYAAWMKEQQPLNEVTRTTSIAWFIEAQLRAAALLRTDPTADVTTLFVRGDHRPTIGSMRFGIVPGYGEDDIEAMHDITTHTKFFRGFVEHVAIKAKHFLKFADELFRRAPIRHLTLTYCADYIEQLAASPHLARIRSLKLPNRMLNNEYTRLNQLTDDHVRVLASSPHLGRLAYLDLEDNDALTPRALDHLALSQRLPALSHVRVDQFRYERRFGALGGEWIRELVARRATDWTPELEARHGYLPWLHADEHYGTWSPDEEPVVEHPVGDAALRPDIAARRRPQLPVALAGAISARLDPAGAIRDRALIAPLPAGRLVATLESAVPHPEIPELVTLVTLTIQQAPGTPVQIFDHATQRTVTAAARTTLTVAIPTNRG